jgi:D-alanine transaminase
MTEWIWLNGKISPLADAKISVEDRGFQFADGVYEVIRFYNGKLFTLPEHLARLKRSAEGIKITLPMEPAELQIEIERLLAKSALQEGMIYLQLTRGAAPRNHVCENIAHTLLFYARELPPIPEPGAGEGVKLISVADERWRRCWIKSIALLPNILAKNEPAAKGADEAVFIENGLVTECAASNIYLILGNRLITHPVGPKVLPGITRAIILEIAPTLGLTVEERGFSLEDIRKSDEIFITSTTREVAWVAAWNNHPIRSNGCGAITKKLHQAYRQKVIAATGMEARITTTKEVLEPDLA